MPEKTHIKGHQKAAGEVNVAAPPVAKLLTREEIGPIYVALMQQVVVRQDAIRDSAAEAMGNPAHESNWKNAEFCYLQIRRICEYVAIALLVAHGENEQFLSSTLMKEWNAGKLFEKLTSLNPNAFPVPVVTELNAEGNGKHHVVPQKPTLDAKELARIYNACGDRLHSASLRRILNGKLPEYNFDDIRDWTNGLTKTLGNHLILLPEISSVMLVVLKDQDDGQVHCSFADADGPSWLGDDFPKVQFEVDKKM
jgi:hypothetical protein